MQISFEAIGTHWWIEIFDEIRNETLDQISQETKAFCASFDQSYSRFKSDSLVTNLNLERQISKAPKEFQEILRCGQSLYARTRGACNLLLGHILEARGYDAEYTFIPQANHRSLAVCNPETDLIIEDEAITLKCGNVDLGGYGKGYLIDCLAKILNNRGFHYFLINGGGDMYATSDHEKPIEIYLEHPQDPSLYVMKTTLLDQGFAASSPFKRKWHHAGRTHTHIVGGESPIFWAGFVKAKTATDADAFAKSCLLLGEVALVEISEQEGIAFAHFNPETNELWQTANFHSQ